MGAPNQFVTGLDEPLLSNGSLDCATERCTFIDQINFTSDRENPHLISIMSVLRQGKNLEIRALHTPSSHPCSGLVSFGHKLRPFRH